MFKNAKGCQYGRNECKSHTHTKIESRSHYLKYTASFQSNYRLWPSKQT